MEYIANKEKDLEFIKELKDLMVVGNYYEINSMLEDWESEIKEQYFDLSVFFEMAQFLIIEIFNEEEFEEQLQELTSIEKVDLCEEITKEFEKKFKGYDFLERGDYYEKLYKFFKNNLKRFISNSFNN